MIGGYFALEPYPDELFSSWAMRICALTHDTAYRTALRLLGSKTAWIRDIDRVVSPEELILAGARAGVAPELALRTCMWSFLIPSDRGRRAGISQGILATGIYHRERRLFGLQFCPFCLAGDRDPYFRKSWRLALRPTCLIHQVLLLSACFRCGAPIALHRTAGVSLCICPNCSVDQRRFTLAMARPIANESAVLQAVSPGDRVRVGTFSIDYPQWLGLARHLWRLLSLNSFTDVVGETGYGSGTAAVPVVDDVLERTAVVVRAYWLPKLIGLLEQGLPAVIAACKSAHITKGELRGYRRAVDSDELSAISHHLAGDQARVLPRFHGRFGKS